MSTTSSNDQKDDSLSFSHRELNDEITYSLSLVRKLRQTSEDLKKAEQVAKISKSDLASISSIANILILQNQNLTDQQIASQLLKELSNSHPNRLIKLICKRMIKQKWGIKNETE